MASATALDDACAVCDTEIIVILRGKLILVFLMFAACVRTQFDALLLVQLNPWPIFFLLHDQYKRDYVICELLQRLLCNTFIIDIINLEYNAANNPQQDSEYRNYGTVLLQTVFLLLLYELLVIIIFLNTYANKIKLIVT